MDVGGVDSSGITGTMYTPTHPQTNNKIITNNNNNDSGCCLVCLHWQSIMENVCRVLKYVCQSMQLHAGPLLQPLAEKLVACFRHRSHSCFLYCSATLVSVFGASPDQGHQALIVGLLGAYAETVCVDGGLLSTAQKFTGG